VKPARKTAMCNCNRAFFIYPKITGRDEFFFRVDKFYENTVLSLAEVLATGYPSTPLRAEGECECELDYMFSRMLQR